MPQITRSLLFTLFLLIVVCNLSGQNGPNDTLYHENGSIARIGYQMDKYYSTHSVDRYFNEGVDIEHIGRLIADTVYLKSRGGPNVYTRLYYENDVSVVLRYEKDFTKDITILPPKSLSFRILGEELISIIYGHGKNSTIKSLQVNIIDSNNHHLKAPLISIYPDNDTIFKDKQKLNLRKFGVLDISYRLINLQKDITPTCYVKDIHYTWYLKNASYGKYVELYTNFQLKITGNYFNNIKTGKWKEWYRNGNLLSEGNYIPKYGYDDGNVFAYPVKDGKWYYYAENGLMIRSEKWKKGENKKTKTY